MQSIAAVRERTDIPMTPERAMTAVTQCWVAAERAHHYMVEALEIMENLAGNGSSPGDASEHAFRVVPLPRILNELVELRVALLDMGSTETTPG